MPLKSYAKDYNPKVYLIVINKLTLSDLKSMENLRTIISEGSIGLMNTRGASGYTGVESFLTINSSNKTTGNYGSIDFQTIGPENSIINKSLYKLENLNKNNRYTPRIGAIGDNIHKSGLKTAIYGNSDLAGNPSNPAALIPMDSNGLVDYANIDNITLEDSSYPFLKKTNYPKLLNEIMDSQGSFIVVDTGDLDRIYRYSDFLSDTDYHRLRGIILLDLDRFIEDLSINIRDGKSLLIISSPNSGDPRIDNNKLSPIILWGQGINNRNLISKTTNRQGLVSNLDLGPTVVEFLDANNENMAGNKINTLAGDLNLEEITRESSRINTTSKARYNTLYSYGIISMVILVFMTVLIWGKVKISASIVKTINILLANLFFIPSNLILTSIFKPTSLSSFIVTLLLLLVFSFFVIWLTRNYKRQLLYLSLFTTLLILLDLLFKGAISRYSVLSYDPIIGARYYGIGNEMVGLLLASITVFSYELIEIKHKTILPLILYGFFAILVGHYNYGANFGGSMVFIISFLAYIINMSTNNLSYKKILLGLLSIIIFISALAYIDIRFSKNITHLGTSILNIKNNGLNYLYDIILRKGLMNLKLINKSFWTYLLFFHVFIHGLIFEFNSNDRNRAIIIIAGIVGSLVGVLLNDSGIILGSISMNIITIGIYIEFIKAR